jgi:hypothetical protein
VPQGKRIEFRIGINVGDIIIDLKPTPGVAFIDRALMLNPGLAMA